MRSFLSALFLISVLFSPAPASATPLKAVASFSILGDMVQQVAGTKADVTVLVGFNRDPHTYQPSPADIRAMSDADVLFVNGLGFEGWMDRLIESSGFKGTVVVASRGVRALKAPVRAEEEHGEDHDHGEFDPHAWQSLANGIVYVSNIRAALVKADPKNGATYKANALLFIKEMGNLEKWMKREIKMIPEYKRRVITSHDAFEYLGKTYGVQFFAPVGMNTEAEPSARAIAKLIDQIREQKIHALFMENITRFGTLDQLKREAGGFIGGTLYSDALSEPDGPAGSYLTMYRYNVTQLIAGMNRNPNR